MSHSAMRVRLLSFGPLKSAFGGDRQWRELAPGATVGTLLTALRGESLVAESALASAAVAVNQQYVRKDHVLADGDEVALLPPVSGGSEPYIRLQTEVIDAQAAEQALSDGADGAMVVFDGKVRNNTSGRQTLHLDYEAYEEMALKQMHGLREDALVKFPVRDVAIVHRLGRLVIGETSVLIVVSSAHRGAAFEACRWVIDTLKKQVPIWKKEQFVDGALWADGEPFPEDIVEAKR